MKNYKVLLDVESEEKGRHTCEVYVKNQLNEEYAERSVKYYFIEKGFVFYGLIKISEL